ncbi:NADPH-dependent oxidoreductase [Pseudomonas asplenii]|uniref:NADPH-dependent oxidoreductase n=1 Tax=Pseudomonas asplenii TaxID=53407 RepID=UPI00037A8A68|nr:NADPH-dependent oxidoreductase [Pseudomonas fuscovaginae]
MNVLTSSLDALWQARYGLPPSEADLPHNAVLQSLLEHRSVRAFLPDALPAGALEAGVAAAQSASTSSNLQVWSVIAIRDPARRARFAELSGGQRHIEQAPLFLAWVLDLSRLRRLGDAREQATDGLDYLETFVVGSVDTALAAQNAAVAFESLGLGIVYIGGMRNHPEIVAEELGLPAGSLVLFGMCVGHPDPALPATVKPRLPQSVVLHHDRYGATDELQQCRAYDEQMRQAQSRQGRAVQPWSEAVVQRVAGPASLSGRDRLREVVAALGFELR